MARLIARRPGLRLPGTMDRFELAVRAVLGQQVSVAGANTIAGRLVHLVGAPIPRGGGTAPAMLTHLPVAAERLAATRPSRVAGIGIPRARAACLVSLARTVADGELPELAGDGPAADPEGFIGRFTALPGIGAWTAEYVAMRALGWRDAFPAGDLGLRKAMGGMTEAALRGAAERWRPWRAYAAQHLWASLGDGANRNQR
jgi:AraC family transcriptional regulator of adaptative response / DNA-3-methyladenine glycosylase II